MTVRSHVSKVVSGGQTGGDLGALIAAKTMGLETGGWAPKGWRTDIGPNPELGSVYGLLQHRSSAYPPRTEANVRDSDGTLIFGKTNSPGCTFTRRCCLSLGQPVFVVAWHTGRVIPDPEAAIAWLIGERIEVLNVAGNRESKNPGIQDAIGSFLRLILQGGLLF